MIEGPRFDQLWGVAWEMVHAIEDQRSGNQGIACEIPLGSCESGFSRHQRKKCHCTLGSTEPTSEGGGGWI